MADSKIVSPRRQSLIEKIVQRILSTIGGVFGGGRKRDAPPSTNDLSERLKRMIDERLRRESQGAKLAPHYIKLKHAWGQTSDEFQSALKKIQNELMLVAVEHINDNRYRTLAPVKVVAKGDILTSGFSLSIGFDETDAANSAQVQVPLEVFAKILPLNQMNESVTNEITITATATFPNRSENTTKLRFVPNDKDNMTVGRTKENDLFLDDNSISRHHATLVLNADGKLRVADTGSTNGTFLNRERIAYGKAYEITPNDVVGFGEILVKFTWEMPIEELPQTVEQQVITMNVGTAQLSETYLSQQNLPQVSVDSVEPTTRLSTENIESNDDEPRTVIGNLQNDEPQTVLGDTKNSDEPQTVFGGATAENAPPVTTQLVQDLPESVQTTIMDLPQELKNKQLAETSQLPSATRILNSEDVNHVENDDLRTVLNQEVEPDLSTFLNKEIDAEPQTVFNETPENLKRDTSDDSQNDSNKPSS